jgi:hypothetical protein
MQMTDFGNPSLDYGSAGADYESPWLAWWHSTLDLEKSQQTKVINPAFVEFSDLPFSRPREKDILCIFMLNNGDTTR